MTGDLSLFGDDESVVPEPPKTKPAAQWQIDLLRRALDRRNLTTMAERQQAIETAVGHPVESLRALTADEALQAVNGLAADRSEQGRTTSAWDDREEDTWIDRI